MAALPLLMRTTAGSAVAAQEIPRAPSSATVTDRLQVLLSKDVHPDHNAFMEAELRAYAELNGWPIEVTDIAGYQGGGELNQKLLSAVQTGSPPDLLVTIGEARNRHTLGLVQPVTGLVAEMTERYGEPIPGARFDAAFADEWWAVPFFTRVNGLFVRQDLFAAKGLDIVADTETYDGLRQAALTISDPDQSMWGWGMTVNRSGDGATLVKNVIFRFGEHLQDETGQLVTFNSAETVAALEWLKETYSAEQYAPILPPGTLAWTDASNNEAFLAGQTAITQNAGTVYAKAVIDGIPFADQIAFIPNPKRLTDGARLDFLSDGMEFFVVTDAPNKAAAEDVIRHFLTEPVLERVWGISTGYALPAYERGWDNPIVTQNANSMRAKEVALTETGFNGLPWPGEDNEALASIDAGTHFTEMMSDILPGRPVEEVVADYHERFVEIYQDFGRTGA